VKILPDWLVDAHEAEVLALLVQKLGGDVCITVDEIVRVDGILSRHDDAATGTIRFVYHGRR
jgi:hypothetical protein